MAGFLVPLKHVLTGEVVGRIRVRVRSGGTWGSGYYCAYDKVAGWFNRRRVPPDVYVGIPINMPDEVTNAAVEGGDQRAEWLGRRATTIGGGGDGPRF